MVGATASGAGRAVKFLCSLFLMSETVVSVEHLSKSYLIGHEGPQERYYSLRDAFVRQGRAFARKAVDMARGRQIIHGQTVEEFWALKDVTFEVKRGEVLGIIGRNGAGKSTLLKVLSRITEPTSGRVVLDGRVASLLEVGTGFHPELTGRENIFLNGAILGMGRAEIARKFDEIVNFAGVEKFLDTPVKRYSSGMYVRLAFAVAAHLEPEILVIDEVLAVGDAEFQKKCLGKMEGVAKGGRTVLFVSHNMAAVESLCTSAIHLDGGRVIGSGSPRTCMEAYLNPVQRSSEIRFADRKGRRQIEITDLEVSHPDGIATGRPLSVSILFSRKGVQAPLPTEFGISIWNATGTRIISISTTQTGVNVSRFSEGRATCVIPELVLVEGTYSINAFVSSDHGLEDYIVGIAQLVVSSGDFFGTGKTVDPEWGLVAVRHSWEK